MSVEYSLPWSTERGSAATSRCCRRSASRRSRDGRRSGNLVAELPGGTGFGFFSEGEGQAFDDVTDDVLAAADFDTVDLDAGILCGLDHLHLARAGTIGGVVAQTGKAIRAIARLAGIDVDPIYAEGQRRIAALNRRTADTENPSQPVPEPSAQPASKSAPSGFGPTVPTTLISGCLARTFSTPLSV